MNKEFQTIIKVGMNSTEFNKNSAEVSRRIKLLDTSFREASARAKAFGETTDTLKQKYTALSEKINIQTLRVKNLKDQYEKSKKETGENSKATSVLAIKYNNAITSLRKMEGQLEKTNKDIKAQSKAFTEAQKKLKEYGERAKKVGQQAKEVSNGMLKVGTAVTAIGVAITKFGVDFDTSMRKVKTIADEAQVSNEKLSKSVLELSKKYGESSTGIAEALYQTLSAGVETSKSITFLDDAIKNSIGGFTDATTSVNTLTNILNAYGLETEKVMEISDKLLVLQKLGKTTIGEFGDTIGRVAPLAAQANVSVDELLSSITALTKGSIKDKEAITAMKAIIASIIKPTEEASKEAEKLGLNFSATGLKAKGFSKFLDLVMKSTGGNTESLTKLFGSVEALNAVMLLTSSKGNKDFKEALDAMANSVGTTDEAVQDMDGTGRTLARTIESVKTSAIKAFQALEPAIQGVLGFIKLVFGSLGNLNPKVLQTIAIFGALVFTLGIFVKIGSSIATISGAISAGLAAVGVASGGASVGMGALGAVSAASVSPILLVVGALAALAVVLAVIIGRSGEVTDSINSIGNMKMPQIEVPKLETPKVKYNTYRVDGINGYDTGTNRLSKDQLIYAHKDEAIVPAKDNPFNPDATTNGLGGGDIFNIYIDAKTTKEYNDLVLLAKSIRRTRRAGVAF
ncbi:phage tail tape measure protein [Vallitalea guaymasensis]|uniref:Phage tail tape measure protein n=1 Tax=Vallitalea guaymasensis TaxID=1185412 RepID=A0A8J8SB05_9FIRM|nr:phage tail tape measure protein [Vallitalea guaymasensis]QUH28222.1 phage tail tape measure protein [Vallitalea guaymasensis]